MKIFSKNKNKAFTLIELLVVVAIVSLLASVILASLSSARGKARDAKRMQDLRQVQTALELYRSTNGSYPDTGESWEGCINDNSNLTGLSGYIPGLAPDYIPVLPTDPGPGDSGGCYIYISNGTDYAFLVWLTVEGVVPDSLRRPGTYSYEQDYAIYSSAEWAQNY